MNKEGLLKIDFPQNISVLEYVTTIFGDFLNLKSKNLEQDLNTEGGFVVFKLFASFLKAFALSLSLSEL